MKRRIRSRSRRNEKRILLFSIICFVILYFMGTGYSLLRANVKVEGKSTLILGNLKPTPEEYFTIDEQTGIITAFSDREYAGQLVIPEKIKGIKVEAIGEGVFDHCSKITSAVLPDTVTIISDNAFAYCTRLESINIPYGVTTIGEGAFRDCYKVSNYDIPNTVTSIGDNAFREGQSLVEIKIPDSVITIGTWVFAGCSNLEKVTIGSGVTQIGSSTFSYDPKLTSLVIKSGSTLEVPQDKWGAGSATVTRL